MKGNKLTSIKVKEYLKSVAGKVALENLKTIQPQKIVDWFDLLNSSNNITDANIDYFVDTNFANIFK